MPSSTGHGQYVAGKCECRPEYAGLDCEKCADGYVENKNVNSFTCVLDTNNTKPGYCRKDTCGCIYKGALCVTPLGTCDDSTGKVLCTCNASLHVQGPRCGEVWTRLPPFRVLAICVFVARPLTNFLPSSYSAWRAITVTPNARPGIAATQRAQCMLLDAMLSTTNVSARSTGLAPRATPAQRVSLERIAQLTPTTPAPQVPQAAGELSSRYINILTYIHFHTFATHISFTLLIFFFL